jgi:hypothetical protein
MSETNYSPFIPMVYPGAPNPMAQTNFGMPNLNPTAMALGTGGFNPQNVTADVPMFNIPGAAAFGQANWGTGSAPTTPQVGGAGGISGLLASLKSIIPEGFLDQYNKETGLKSGQGWGGAAFGAASGIANAFMGMQQYGLAKKALAQSKDQYDQNYAAQRTTTNTQLEDRQRARVASNSSAYESVGSYMDRNAIR